MNVARRIVLSAGLALASGIAPAQGSWPAGKTIRIVVPFPAGGQTDVAARVIAQALGESLKTSIMVENKSGAHGFVGAVDAARAPADGYTLFMASTGTMAINPKLHVKMPYDPNRDFVPVSLLLMVPIAIMVNPQTLNVDSVQELVAYAKAHPGQVNFASAGNGGSSHLVGEYFKYRTGTFLTHIPYRGQAPAIGDVVAGQVHMMFDSLVSSTPYIKAGKLKTLAFATRARLPEYPDVPTVAEALKIADFEASSWAALYAPAGTPQEIVKRISAEIDAALKTPMVAQRLKELGAIAVGGPPERLASFQAAEQKKWAEVIKAANVKPD